MKLAPGADLPSADTFLPSAEDVVRRVHQTGKRRLHAGLRGFVRLSGQSGAPTGRGRRGRHRPPRGPAGGAWLAVTDRLPELVDAKRLQAELGVTRAAAVMTWSSSANSNRRSARMVSTFRSGSRQGVTGG